MTTTLQDRSRSAPLFPLVLGMLLSLTTRLPAQETDAAKPQTNSLRKLLTSLKVKSEPREDTETGIARIRRQLPDVSRRLKQAVAPGLSKQTPHTAVVKELERLRQQSSIPAIPRIGQRLPDVRRRLQRTFTPQPKQAAPSQTVLEELQRLYRQSGVPMPRMAFPEPDRTTSPPKKSKPAAPRAIQPAAASHLTSRLTDNEKRKKIARRGSRAGLKGFCPVALIEDRQLLDTRHEINVTHSGHVHLFSSVAARQKFQSNPRKYLPAANGMDVVLKSRRRIGPGSLDHAVLYDGRLYLFAEAGSLRTFQADPAAYAESREASGDARR